MQVPNYLVKGSNFRYYFRIIVPKPLRPIIGQREFRRALKTMDRCEALRMSLALADKFLRFFEAERVKIDPLMKQLKIYETANGYTYEMDDDDIDKDIERLRKHKEAFGDSVPATSAPAASAPAAPASLMLSEAIAAYAQEKQVKKAWTEGTAAENISAYKKLVALLVSCHISNVG